MPPKKNHRKAWRRVASAIKRWVREQRLSRDQANTNPFKSQYKEHSIGEEDPVNKPSHRHNPLGCAAQFKEQSIGEEDPVNKPSHRHNSLGCAAQFKEYSIGEEDPVNKPSHRHNPLGCAAQFKEQSIGEEDPVNKPKHRHNPLGCAAQFKEQSIGEEDPVNKPKHRHNPLNMGCAAHNENGTKSENIKTCQKGCAALNENGTKSEIKTCQKGCAAQNENGTKSDNIKTCQKGCAAQNENGTKSQNRTCEKQKSEDYRTNILIHTKQELKSRKFKSNEVLNSSDSKVSSAKHDDEECRPKKAPKPKPGKFPLQKCKDIRKTTSSAAPESTHTFSSSIQSKPQKREKPTPGKCIFIKKKIQKPDFKISCSTTQKEQVSSSAYKDYQFQSSSRSLSDIRNTDHELAFVSTDHSVVQGSFHQNHPQFGSNSGKQCVANSLYAIVHDKIKPISSWGTIDLNQVLYTGNDLYTNLRRSSNQAHDLLLVTEIPEMLEINDTLYMLNRGESKTGLLRHDQHMDENEVLMNLDMALQSVFSEHNNCFVTFGSNTFSVIQRNDTFYIFDSHSRTRSGLFGLGSSIILRLDSLMKVYEHCLRLSDSLKVGPHAVYEVTGITVNFPRELTTGNTTNEDDNDINTCDDDSTNCHLKFDDSVSEIEIDDVSEFEIISGDEEIKLAENTKQPDSTICNPSSSQTDFEICDTQLASCHYYPLSVKAKVDISKDIGIPIHTENQSFVVEGVVISVPCKSFPITEDGNCFFRCISKEISGSEQNHEKIREAVVNHLKENPLLFSSFLREGYNSVDQYIIESRIMYDGTWATEMEIIATAHLMHTDIWTYSENKWLKYSTSLLSDRTYDQHTFQSIYLNHVNENHYELVSCAQIESMDNQCTGNCYSSVKFSNLKRKHVGDDSDVPSVKPKKIKGLRLRKEAKKQYMRNKRKLEEQTNDSTCSNAKEPKETNQERKRRLDKESYRNNSSLREKKIQISVSKYATDYQFKESLIANRKEKYAKNEQFKESVKANSKEKYAKNEQFKESVKANSKTKYTLNKEHREKIKNQTKLRRRRNTRHMEKMAIVQESFKRKISKGPEHICCVCHRRLFEHQVKACHKDAYHRDRALAERCITYTYLHTCDNSCDEDCSYTTSAAGKMWICTTCHTKLLGGKLPNEAVVNNLYLNTIPPELKKLNELEHHLIALNIPFMKMMSLPKGGQNGVHGPVVCVPSDIHKVTTVLPRCDTDDRMIRVKLKRKLTYKGHYQYKYVNPTNVENALKYLKKHNEYYKDIEFNNSWLNPLAPIPEDNEDECQDEKKTPVKQDSDPEDDEYQDNNANGSDQSGLLMDTCLQPVDVGQEVLDQNFDNIACIAPGEGNQPVRLLMDMCHEAKSFPVMFPSGSPIFQDERDQRITLGRYLHTRLMNADSRFAKNTDYIFYAQYLSELDQVTSQVSIALRKGNNTNPERTVNAETLMDHESLKTILKNDEGYKFLKPIRGTPPFWQSAQKDLFAMLRQLGIPTWFCSFSSADLRWPEILEAIMREGNDFRKACDLDWSEKCFILKKNPVTAARMFDQRFHVFLRQVILSPAQPIGKVIDYFYRVEFQHRGSPHTHCLFWIENAPKIDDDDDDNVVDFVDQYISCEMPLEEHDEELYNIVNTVQKHSKRHSPSCRKKKTTCRFNFPRPPSERTFICRPEENYDQSEGGDNLSQDGNTPNTMSQDQAKAILESVWNAISDTDLTFDSASELLLSLGLSQEIFEQANSTLASKTSIVHRRLPNDVWINQYNAELLKCWNANMDMQFVVDAYSCIVYIISYISKAEREMGLLLSHCQKEAANDGNSDAKSALKKLGASYLHHRELSAQEAVFRVCNLRLKECSRKVQFIPTVNPVKICLPLSELQRKQRAGELDENDMWMPSIVDKYLNRPDTEQLDNVCLAKFCSEYRIVPKAEVSRVKRRRNPLVILKNGLGHMQKRSRTENAVIRYARFCPLKDPEKFYQSMLQLFLPHKNEDQLKPCGFESYESYYREGIVTSEEQAETVKEIVDTNRSFFEKNFTDVVNAEETLERCGPLEDAWSKICPESEKNRLECEEEMINVVHESDEDLANLIPDLQSRENVPSRSELVQTIVSKTEAIGILRSLNDEQAPVFYQIRQWCLNKKNGGDPNPFCVFITGGAGTGKTHLTKAICYEASRLLSQCQPNPDDTSVLVVAPTGVAAFNIGASTIHSALKIGIDIKLPYQPLGEEKINTLRSKLENLHILVIDEVSMVDKRLLSYIHGRLRQVKQRSDHSPFGNVSVVAVGDFYQLPPAKGKPLFSDECGYDLWTDNFQIVELNTIMRQKNPEFAQMLNRLRKHHKKDPLSDSDLTILQNLETGENDLDRIHLYPTNAQVNDHNVTALHSKCSDIVCIKSVNYEKNLNTGKMENKECQVSSSGHSVLPDTLYLAVGARVILTKNLDTSDGLVNGVFGTVTHMLCSDDSQFPREVYVLFDNVKVGNRHRSQKKCRGMSVLIKPEKNQNGKYGVRHQYPLKLAYACTVHKVQGLTIDKATVSLKKIFSSGQAYVALSRVTSLDGLIIQDFDAKAIFCNEKVQDAMSKMPPFITNLSFQHIETDYTLIMHNIEGLSSHIHDIEKDTRFMNSDFICVTETWLAPDSEAPELCGYDFHHKARAGAYESNDPVCRSLANQAHGGVGLFSSKLKQCVVHDFPVSDLEYLAFTIPDVDVSVAVIYRPNSYTLHVFLKYFQLLLAKLESESQGTIVMGDFNENVFISSKVCDTMKTRGYVQKVLEPTTENETLIDHVYVKNLDCVSVEVTPTYFGYHEAVRIFI